MKYSLWGNFLFCLALPFILLLAALASLDCWLRKISGEEEDYYGFLEDLEMKRTSPNQCQHCGTTQLGFGATTCVQCDNKLGRIMTDKQKLLDFLQNSLHLKYISPEDADEAAGPSHHQFTMEAMAASFSHVEGTKIVIGRGKGGNECRFTEFWFDKDGTATHHACH